jgi:hypothetical protein
MVPQPRVIGLRAWDAFLRFITPRRVWSYPLVLLAVLVCVAAYDNLSGQGLLNGISGGFGGDFLAFYTGGSFARRGSSLALTDADAQHAFQRAILGSDVTSVAVWVSPPYFAWLFAPVSALPYVAAYFVFVVLSVLGLFFAFRGLDRALGVSRAFAPSSAFLRRAPALFMFWIAIQYYPTFQWLLNGQITGLWLALSCAVFLLLRRERDFSAGLVLGLFACKPPLAIGLCVALSAARRVRALAGAALSGSALIALGLLTQRDAMRAYLEHGSELVELVRGRGYNTAGLHGSFELATLLLDGISHRLATVAGAAIALLVSAWIAALWWRAPYRPATRAWDLRMAATLAIGVIASPHLYVYDLMLLTLPLFIALAHVPSERGLPLGGGSLLGLTALVWALGLVGPVLTVFQQELTRGLLGFSIALQLGAVVIVLWARNVARLAGVPEGR